MQKTIRLLYKYTIAITNSLVLFFRSFVFLPFRTWLRFWIPGAYTDGEIKIDSLYYTIHSQHLSERIADLYMIMTCVKDKQYNPPSFEIKPHDTIVEVGGHIGSFSVYAARNAPQGRVVVYEPDPGNFTYLQKNIHLNKLSNITVKKMAVAAKKETRMFFPSTVNTAESSMYITKGQGQSIQVPTTTLSHIFEEHAVVSCDFLKLDCEGAEYEILFGTPASCLNKIQKIAMECHNPSYFNIADPCYTQEGMKIFLSRNGFAVTEVRENAMHSLLFARRDT
ncbi:MAG: hypothetical protein A3H64_01985 [Candidatus Ryanbacteria bacterium RIFCSPLOWO2_02_FULL_45_11c]|uniref:Methyltransferase FkbM domain-containing protein n=1 Tax=Candidatus Ryanbacteria bacterium RIFCSPLOWO2_02_FULL_45_11c TaxID=1802128 RepID=A0A1G2H1T5_9BACT|nr:MAG: hypothetical protein A3H64_01985 [Candidatus Ryanbacteria bacterium RIFCSPLOWO2_02_FULL_45_11c]